ncbi:MAG: sigma-70 family RNA polymerase sigma factor [Planctomycetia bacterium]|nr:sigma-70 family RNA polymerase sigma factor [Planctomycetia bacterium]
MDEPGHVATTQDDELPRQVYEVALEYCLRKGEQPADAEEIAQETALAAFLHRGDLIRIPQKIRAWAITVAGRRRIDRFRRKHAHPTSPYPDENLPNLDDELVDSLTAPLAPNDPELTDQIERVRGAVSQLPPPLRQVVELRYIENRTLEEIANRLGVSTPSAFRRVEDAIAQLQQLLAETHTPRELLLPQFPTTKDVPLVTRELRESDYRFLPEEARKKVLRELELAQALAPDVRMSDSVRRQVIQDRTLQYYSGGKIVACVRLKEGEGVAILAVGEEEIGALIRAVPRERWSGVRIEFPMPWE